MKGKKLTFELKNTAFPAFECIYLLKKKKTVCSTHTVLDITFKLYSVYVSAPQHTLRNSTAATNQSQAKHKDATGKKRGGQNKN